MKIPIRERMGLQPMIKTFLNLRKRYPDGADRQKFNLFSLILFTINYILRISIHLLLAINENDRNHEFYLNSSLILLSNIIS